MSVITIRYRNAKRTGSTGVDTIDYLAPPQKSFLIQQIAAVPLGTRWPKKAYRSLNKAEVSHSR